MKTITTSSANKRGFTLVEMIGVLAVIAVLAALLVPRVFSAINDSRINSAAMSYNAVKSASMMYFGNYGKFGGPNGATIESSDLSLAAATNWVNNVLLPEGLLEKPFVVKVGESSVVRLTAAEPNGAAEPTFDPAPAATAAYNLAGQSDPVVNDMAGAQFVIEVIIFGVSLDDAQALNNRIDGAELAGGMFQPMIGQNPDGDPYERDTVGRVKYDFGAGEAVGDVFIYVAHK